MLLLRLSHALQHTVVGLTIITYLDGFSLPIVGYGMSVRSLSHAIQNHTSFSHLSHASFQHVLPLLPLLAHFFLSTVGCGLIVRSLSHAEHMPNW